MKRRSVNALSLTPWITTAIFMGPVVVGLIGTWLPAFGWFPAIGQQNLSVQPWVDLWNHPSFYGALMKTLWTGLGASLLALMLTLLILIGLYPSKRFNLIEKILAPILSIPHAAFAIGLGFLLVPSGWIIRVLSLFTEQFNEPPLWSMFQDAFGWSLMFTLALKEMPFLLFMSLAILPTLNASKTLWLAQSMGHSMRFGWLWIIAPQLYRQIKLPFFAVVTYSLTVVDISLIAGPTTPSTLAVLITQLFADPDLNQRLLAAAGAAGLLTIVGGVLVLLHWAERPLIRLRRWFLCRGQTASKSIRWEVTLAKATGVSLLFFYLSSFVITLFWSIAAQWRFPDLLPQQYALRSWSRVLNRIEDPFWCTLWLASLSASLAIMLIIAVLENEVRLKYQGKPAHTERNLLFIYIPLLVPQIAFLFGFQITLIQLGVDGTFLTLLWSHLVFVVPYVFLTLSGPYRQFDDRYSWVALSLSGQRFYSFWRVKLPLLLRPVLYAFATGFSVSVTQYLPTLFIGAGRFSTITTEAVAMAAGSDRRMMAVIALWQLSLPLIVFLLATQLPAIRFRHRRAMKHNLS